MTHDWWRGRLKYKEGSVRKGHPMEDILLDPAKGDGARGDDDALPRRSSRPGDGRKVLPYLVVCTTLFAIVIVALFFLLDTPLREISLLARTGIVIVIVLGDAAALWVIAAGKERNDA